MDTLINAGITVELDNRTYMKLIGTATAIFIIFFALQAISKAVQ